MRGRSRVRRGLLGGLGPGLRAAVHRRRAPRGVRPRLLPTPRSGSAASRPLALWSSLSVLVLLLAGPPAVAQTPAPAPPGPAPLAPVVPIEDLGLPAPPAPDVSAAGAILYDPADQRALAGVDADTARPIASITKIMTALLALEAGTAGDTVSVSAAAQAAGAAPGVSTLNLRAGSQLPMADLLEGLIIRSGNDAAVAIAEHVDGSEAAFVAHMNARAAELGLTQTSFADASGLGEDPPNQSSPRDLARLTAVAMAVPEFAEWAAIDADVIPSLASGTLENRNELIGAYAGANGVKTGFTTLAGQCLVASAERDGRALYAVVLGSADRATDATALLDHGFDDFGRVAPAAPGAAATRYTWAVTAVDVEVAEPLAVTLPVGTAATWQARLDPVVPLPAPAGTPVGTAELLVGGEVVDRAELRTSADAAAPAPPQGAAGVGSAVEDALRGFARAMVVDRAA